MINPLLALAKQEAAQWLPPPSWAFIDRVATLEAVENCEKQLGFKLPLLLREWYLTGANGGWGPLRSILVGVDGGFLPDDRSIATMYQDFREHGFYPWRGACTFDYDGTIVQGWPEYLLPAFHWSNPTHLCVDCLNPDNPVYFFDVSSIHPQDQSWPATILKVLDSFEALWLDQGGDSLFFSTIERAAKYDSEKAAKHRAR